MLTTAWLYWTRRASLAEAAALDVLGWFTFTTQAHENHLFFAVPLLSLAWPPRRRLLVPLGLVSLSLLMNMVLHDQLLLNAVGRWLDGAALQRLRLANAGLNVVLCVGWVITSGLRSPGGAGALVSVARYRPEQARRVGLEDVSDERTGAPLPR
jgi:hypothetical protein